MIGISSEKDFQRGVISLPGGEIPWFDRLVTTSTMDDAANMVRDGIADWTVVTALTQRSGRGTRGREWNSPPGKGLWMSVILPPPKDIGCMRELPLKAAETLADILGGLTGFHFDVKPPNDVTSRGKKLGGIMVESVTSGENVISLVLGLGLDISVEKRDFIGAGLTEATSILVETGCIPGRMEIIEAFLKKFMTVYEGLAMK